MLQRGETRSECLRRRDVQFHDRDAHAFLLPPRTSALSECRQGLTLPCTNPYSGGLQWVWTLGGIVV